MLLLIAILVAIVLGIWAAQSIPAPFNFVIYAVVTVVVVWVLLSLTGIIHTGPRIQLSAADINTLAGGG